MSRRSGRVLIGISGWKYVPFRGVFYPKGLRIKDELAYAASKFGSIEINGSFYSLQRPEYYRAWRDDTPDEFTFAVKGGRFITHMKKLRDIDTAVSNFFASGVLALEEKLGPFLWQFPENMPCDLERFDRFFSLLPRDTRAARRLARSFDRRLTGRVAFGSTEVRALRHAVEIRNAACATPEFIALLRRQGIGLVVADTAGHFPYLEDVTADFVYVRLHGDEELYASGYGARAIERWARRVLSWSTGQEPDDAQRVSPLASTPRRTRDVYVYFDNDIKVHAPFDALALAAAIERLRRKGAAA